MKHIKSKIWQLAQVKVNKFGWLSDSFKDFDIGAILGSIASDRKVVFFPQREGSNRAKVLPCLSQKTKDKNKLKQS